MQHVYVHVPFCASKCPYCDFNSHAGRDGEQAAYVDALLVEASRRAAGARPRTVFIGGGTPTHLETPRLERLLDGLLAALGTERLEELTVEANPGSLDVAKIRALKRAGVQRLSLGVQSLDDRHLRTLGRGHAAVDAVRGAALARDGGIDRLSLDLILAIPGQTLADQERDLARALELAPEHVSAYVLTFEEGTPFARRLVEGHLPVPHDERDLAHLHLAIDRLAAAGFERYEVSNFARPGARCRHNVAYWLDEDWIGLGAGAHSHAQARRWKNVDDPARYVGLVRQGSDATAWVETAPPAVAAFEALLMGLRLADGVDLERVAARTGFDVRRAWAAAFAAHGAAGRMSVEGARVRMTPEGFDVLSAVLRDFVPDEESRREVCASE